MFVDCSRFIPKTLQTRLPPIVLEDVYEIFEAGISVSHFSGRDEDWFK